jgi:hypothetical protein
LHPSALHRKGAERPQAFDFLAECRRFRRPVAAAARGTETGHRFERDYSHRGVRLMRAELFEVLKSFSIASDGRGGESPCGAIIEVAFDRRLYRNLPRPGFRIEDVIELGFGALPANGLERVSDPFSVDQAIHPDRAAALLFEAVCKGTSLEVWAPQIEFGHVRAFYLESTPNCPVIGRPAYFCSKSFRISPFLAEASGGRTTADASDSVASVVYQRRTGQFILKQGLIGRALPHRSRAP